MTMSQKRSPGWVLVPRIDSRYLLKILISINVFLALYLILSMAPGAYRTSPCVVVLNNTSNSHILVKSPFESSVSFAVVFSVPAHTLILMQRQERRVVSLAPAVVPRSQVVKAEPQAVVAVPAAESNDDDSKSMPQSPWWTTETRTSYSVINNYVIADDDVAHDSVTLSTQGSFEFLYHAVELCRRWEGPISLAVYAPGDEMRIALEIIYFMRRCRDPCVRSRVSFHLIYDSMLGPHLSNISFPDSLVTKYRSLKCDLSDEELLKEFPSQFREIHRLPYPINVARNVARLQSRTKYLLASDIELYPSLNIVSMFKVLVKKEELNQVPLVNREVPHVYHLPIFEVESGLEAPQTKSELMDMFRTGDAIFFHKWVCDICQNFPDRDQWLQIPGNGTLNVFRSTKRTRNRSSWEPLYIGTNAEPLYDERLTWEGKRDKMSQMYEMCLMNYDILVLDNAFLVHAPGIKHIDEQDNSRRVNFIKRNNQVYNTILAKLRKQYGNQRGC